MGWRDTGAGDLPPLIQTVNVWRLRALVDDGFEALALGVLCLALSDYLHGNGHSAEGEAFLVSAWGGELIENLGLDRQTVLRMARAERTERDQEHAEASSPI